MRPTMVPWASVNDSYSHRIPPKQQRYTILINKVLLTMCSAGARDPAKEDCEKCVRLAFGNIITGLRLQFLPVRSRQAASQTRALPLWICATLQKNSSCFCFVPAPPLSELMWPGAR